MNAFPPRTPDPGFRRWRRRFLRRLPPLLPLHASRRRAAARGLICAVVGSKRS